jgi:hypothetical protein
MNGSSSSRTARTHLHQALPHHACQRDGFLLHLQPALLHVGTSSRLVRLSPWEIAAVAHVASSGTADGGGGPSRRSAQLKEVVAIIVLFRAQQR